MDTLYFKMLQSSLYKQLSSLKEKQGDEEVGMGMKMFLKFTTSKRDANTNEHRKYCAANFMGKTGNRDIHFSSFSILVSQNYQGSMWPLKNLKNYAHKTAIDVFVEWSKIDEI